MIIYIYIYSCIVNINVTTTYCSQYLLYISNIHKFFSFFGCDVFILESIQFGQWPVFVVHQLSFVCMNISVFHCQVEQLYREHRYLCINTISDNICEIQGQIHNYR